MRVFMESRLITASSDHGESWLTWDASTSTSAEKSHEHLREHVGF